MLIFNAQSYLQLHFPVLLHKMRERLNLAGRQFHNLTALYREQRGREAWWECLCKCGSKKMVRQTHLVSQRVRSCGCSRYVWVAEKLRERYIKHGLTRTSMYKTWSSMKDRCVNQANPSYEGYGGRGISVCDRWINSFESFLLDMGYRPVGCSIERIDNNGNYEPSNCRWATRKQQASNTRSVHWVTINGTKMTMTDAAKSVGMRVGTLSERIRRGMDDQEALSTPVQKRRVTI